MHHRESVGEVERDVKPGTIVKPFTGNACSALLLRMISMGETRPPRPGPGQRRGVLQRHHSAPDQDVFGVLEPALMLFLISWWAAWRCHIHAILSLMGSISQH